MPFQAGWLIIGHVSYFRYSGNVTLADMREAREVGLEFLDSAVGPLVHSIQDGGDVTSFPLSVNTLVEATRGVWADPRMGWTVAVSIHDPAVRFVAMVTVQIGKGRYRFLPTLEEGLAFLNTIDPSLVNLVDYARALKDPLWYDHLKQESTSD